MVLGTQGSLSRGAKGSPAFYGINRFHCKIAGIYSYWRLYKSEYFFHPSDPSDFKTNFSCDGFCDQILSKWIFVALKCVHLTSLDMKKSGASGLVVRRRCFIVDK